MLHWAPLSEPRRNAAHRQRVSAVKHDAKRPRPDVPAVAGGCPAASADCRSRRVCSVPACCAQPQAAVVVPRRQRHPFPVESRAVGRRGPKTPHARARSRPARTALRAGVRPHFDLSVLGMVLAPGLRFASPHRRAAAVCVRVRHAAQLVAARHLHARLRTVSDHLQHQPVPVVQAGLVLSAVCHDRASASPRRNSSAGARTDGRRTSSIRRRFTLAIFSLALLADRHERHHLGSGDRDDAVLSAAHLPVAVSGRRCPGSSSSASRR